MACNQRALTIASTLCSLHPFHHTLAPPIPSRWKTTTQSASQQPRASGQRAQGTWKSPAKRRAKAKVPHRPTHTHTHAHKCTNTPSVKLGSGAPAPTATLVAQTNTETNTIKERSQPRASRLLSPAAVHTVHRHAAHTRGIDKDGGAAGVGAREGHVCIDTAQEHPRHAKHAQTLREKGHTETEQRGRGEEGKTREGPGTRCSPQDRKKKKKYREQRAERASSAPCTETLAPLLPFAVTVRRGKKRRRGRGEVDETKDANTA